MIPFIILAIAGIALLAAGIVIKKKHRIALIVSGSALLVIGAVMVLLTVYFAWAVANDAPGPYDDMSTGGGTSGADWRTWRSYSSDYVISDDVTVCMSPFDDRSGYAVYDSTIGDRIGSLTGIEITGNDNFVTEDLDGDGINELGVIISGSSSSAAVYYRYTGEAWEEGTGGGCFEPVQ